MTHENIVKALRELTPSAEWNLSGDNYEDLVWLSASKKPTVAEIEAEIALIPTKEAAKKAALEADKAALLTRLGITAQEAKLLLS